MATRKENLKKINDELEKLDDEQLEKVAGGSWIPRCNALAAIDAINQENQNQIQIPNVYGAGKK